MQTSGPKTPCPVCQRTKDADCRFTTDLILCHTGTDLRPGECITIDGQQWAFIRHNGGFSGQAAVFRPHREGFKPSGNRNADLDAKARRSIASFSLTRFLDRFKQCWDTPDFHTLNAEEFNAAKQLIDDTAAEAVTLSRTLPVLWRQHPELADLYRWRVESCFKNIKAQRDDAQHFASYYLGEVEL
jgi:hypothetical protein